MKEIIHYLQDHPWVIIFQLLSFAGGWYAVTLIQRLNKAHQFLMACNELALCWATEHKDEIIANQANSPYEWFIPQWPSHHKMVFSKKGFYLDDWFSPDICERLKSSYDPNFFEGARYH